MMVATIIGIFMVVLLIFIYMFGLSLTPQFFVVHGTVH